MLGSRSTLAPVRCEKTGRTPGVPENSVGDQQPVCNQGHPRRDGVHMAKARQRQMARTARGRTVLLSYPRQLGSPGWIDTPGTKISHTEEKLQARPPNCPSVELGPLINSVAAVVFLCDRGEPV